ncbi:MAG: twin-arginine translocation protein TatA/E family subunit [Solirubrobacterales bacterium]|nr:twin-arginine translocation protein TatA/E family subunit [Solirubrobacterales bacterium]
MPNIGPTELIILLVILLVIFGPKRLPGLGKQLGTGMRDFKDAVTSRHDADDEDDDEVPERPALTRAAAPADATPPAAARETAPERTGQDA